MRSMFIYYYKPQFQKIYYLELDYLDNVELLFESQRKYFDM